jgi:hypothetical protein
MSDPARQRLYKVRDALGIRSTDALWTLMIVLEYYLALFEKIPEMIAAAVSKAVAAAKETAEAQARAAAEETKRALTEGVRRTVNEMAKRAALKDILRWVGLTVLVLSTIVVAVGRWEFAKGQAEGQWRAEGLAQQDRERRAAESSWASTPDGRLAYDFAKAGIMHDMVRCSGRGLVARDGWCIAQGERGRPFRWRLPEDPGSE